MKTYASISIYNCNYLIPETCKD